jgi:hypothetical protein
LVIFLVVADALARIHGLRHHLCEGRFNMATFSPKESLSYGVHSEVGQLRKVLVCAPGLAHTRLTPTTCPLIRDAVDF